MRGADRRLASIAIREMEQRLADGRMAEFGPEEAAWLKYAFDRVSSKIPMYEYLRRVFRKCLDIHRDPLGSASKTYTQNSYGLPAGSRKVEMDKVRIVYVVECGRARLLYLGKHDEMYEEILKQKGEK